MSYINATIGGASIPTIYTWGTTERINKTESSEVRTIPEK